ncbi:IS110 family transposase, partial [Clostridium neonatale]
MISVGIDVSKGKSTVCILKEYGEVISEPHEINHTEADLKALVESISELNEETR